MRHRSRFAALALLCLAPLAASASQGYVTGNVNLRAGPDLGYPPIMTVPTGSDIDIQGCLDDYSWCDVIVAGNRGWVVGNYIQYVYEDQRVYVPDYGPRLGIPVVTFVIGTYWGNYYRNRSFYHQRDYWYSRPMPHRPPPPRPGYRPPSRPPGWDHRPGGDYRPPGGDHRPPPRPNPGNDHRPPPRPNPGGENRPPPRPNPGGDNRPPGGGRPPGGNGPGRPPEGGHGPGGRPQENHQQARPAPNRDDGKNDDHK